MTDSSLFLAKNHQLRLSKPEDAIRVFETGLFGLIFTIDDIDEDFFDLKNGVLGETFQKLVNYRFPIAIVFPENHNFGPRVTELAREHAKHPIIRFFRELKDAEAWMENLSNTQ